MIEVYRGLSQWERCILIASGEVDVLEESQVSAGIFDLVVNRLVYPCEATNLPKGGSENGPSPGTDG